jgi:hypothetical protein
MEAMSSDEFQTDREWSPENLTAEINHNLRKRVARLETELRWWLEAAAQLKHHVRKPAPACSACAVILRGRTATATLLNGEKPKLNNPATIDDDFNPPYTATCPKCGEPMQLVRPGKVQCPECG